MLADFVGSTKEIMEYASKSSNTRFVIATEQGVYDRLKRDLPEKEFYMIRDDIICTNMKWNSLEDIYNVLKTEQNEIEIERSIQEKAYKCINRMMEGAKV